MIWSVWAAELLPQWNIPVRDEHVDVLLAALLVTDGDPAEAETLLSNSTYSARRAMRRGESLRLICSEAGYVTHTPLRAALILIDFDRVRWCAMNLRPGVPE